MIEYTPPLPPEIKFGVWDYGGNPVEAGYSGPTTAGYRIVPRYSISGRITYANRADAEQHMDVQQDRYARQVLQQKMALLTLPIVLQGRTITRIEHRDYQGIDFHLEGGYVISTHFTRQYWQKPVITLPTADGFWVVKRMLATQKTIRLENGESILLNFVGRLGLNAIPDGIMTELFGGG